MTTLVCVTGMRGRWRWRSFSDGGLSLQDDKFVWGSIDMGGITIWGMAEESESKAKSKAAGEGARSTSAQRSYSSEDIDAGAGGTREMGRPR
jgi:hypothetical protein